MDARTNLADRKRLLVHMHVEAGPVERERGGKATDPTTDDRQREGITHVTKDTPSVAVALIAARSLRPGRASGNFP